ncbi:cardiolipin synthase [Thermincola potens]|uniref:Cardiolipin synthase n=1 Tax=Thermincola potens (strain JR) TaxID=635013 RepID=D5XDC7_THEPJ|nr:cardiolipin synthase [Thermincola potens]ADG81775.1 phospholipase D/Transphosphatidylase [Thermincola potens JR]
MLGTFWSAYGEKILWVYSFSSTILIIIVSILIFMERRNPYKTIAWLAVINVFPILGFIFYFMFGQNRHKRKLIRTKYINEMNHLREIVRRQIECINSNREAAVEALGSKKQLIRLLLNNAHAPFTRRNRAQVLSDGQEAFAAMFAEMEKAQDHIHLEYYIIRDDNIGNQLKDLLISKAKSGVKVRVIYDAVGSWKLSKKYISDLRDSGVQIEPFLPVALPFINNKLNYRNHRKITVIDGKVGFLGGLNIGDEYLGCHPKLGKWRDTHLKLEGTAVHFLQVIFLLDWEFVSGERLSNPTYFPEEPCPGIDPPKGKVIQIAASGPDSDWEAIRQSYFAMINAAEHSIKITTPYLIPDEGILLALKTAALSGVNIKIILPGKPDHKIVQWASQSYFEELMEAGIEIYLYQPGFIHAKIISVDGEVASLGSANLDMRSFQINFEVNAMLYNKSLVEKIDADFEADLAKSLKLQMSDVADKPLPARIRQSAARLLSPLL